MDRDLLNAREGLHSGRNQAFVVVALPSFLNPLLPECRWARYSTRVGNRTTIGEELRNVLNAARAIFGLGEARLRQFLVETMGPIKDDLANCSRNDSKRKVGRGNRELRTPRLAIRATCSDWPRLYLYPVPAEADF